MNSSRLSDPVRPVDLLIKYNQNLCKILGRGTYGVVYQGKYEENLVAVKRIQRIDSAIHQETNTMNNLNHQNIVQLICIQQDDDFMYLVMELCQGTVDDYIKAKLKRDITHLMPSEPDALVQMASGLQYIHDKHFVHRDIKPANVLISINSSRNERAILKISDFGFCKTVKKNNKSFVVEQSTKGTLLYMAPEYRKMIQKSNEKFKYLRASVSIDIFSLGCLFFIYITKKNIFAEPNESNKYYTFINFENNEKNLEKNGLHIDHYAYQIIDGMTQTNPADRWSLEKVVEILKDVVHSDIKGKVADDANEIPIILPLSIIKYKTGETLLGEGGYGIVYKRTYNEMAFAIKQISFTTLKFDRDLINRESEAMKKLNHENVLKLINKLEYDNILYLVLELCQGTVQDYIDDNLEKEIYESMPSEPKALHQMASGLQFIHKNLLVHRDVKPLNVLISTTGSTKSAILKISDFNLTKPVTPISKRFTVNSSIKGTIHYMAPEYLELDEKTAEEKEKIRASVSIDIFSLGCLFFAYVTKGKHAFATPGKKNLHLIVANIIEGKKDLKGNGLNGDHYAFQIIDGMTQTIPDKRWSLDHVFINLHAATAQHKQRVSLLTQTAGSMIPYENTLCIQEAVVQPTLDTIKIFGGMHKLIGEGSFSKVFEIVFNGMKVAVKRIQLLDLNTENNRERIAMKTLVHENVLKLIGEQQDDNFKYLVLELCLGTIDDYINNKYNGDVPRPEAIALTQMASGLAYIHSQGLVHRDIKPANVLISPEIILKISDFGFSKTTSPNGSFSTTSGGKGTKNFMAPEYLALNEESDEERKSFRADKSVDVFSLGCVFFSFLTKGHLFIKPGPKKNIHSIIPNIIDGKKYLNNGLEVDHYAYDMIDKMTQPEPSERLTLDNVIQTLKHQSL